MAMPKKYHTPEEVREVKRKLALKRYYEKEGAVAQAEMLMLVQDVIKIYQQTTNVIETTKCLVERGWRIKKRAGHENN